MRVLGLDIGDVRIGVALSDPTETIASPLSAIKVEGRGQAISEIASLVEEHQVETVVVGMPISLNGQKGRQANKVQKVCDQLSSILRVPVETWDERFSTQSAERFMRETGTRPSKQKEMKDSLAASIILQSYLDGRRQTSINGV